MFRRVQGIPRAPPTGYPTATTNVTSAHHNIHTSTQYVIVTDRGLGFQVSYGPGPCSRKTERAKRARSSCCTDQVRN